MSEGLRSYFECIDVFFVLYMLLYASFIFLSVTVGSATLYGVKKRSVLKNELSRHYYIPVSIIVPAYNEAVTIESTIRSLLSLDYWPYEIIVVDDGSSDDTTEVVRKALHMQQIKRPIQRKIFCQPVETVFETRAGRVPVTLIRKKNGGKADSLNMGINAARYPYYLCMDADSVLQRDSLEKIVRPVLEDDTVVAVGGSVRPCNGADITDGRIVRYRMPKNVLACMQALEYDRSFLAARILFDKFNGGLIISGAFGLFKKSVVIDAGGYMAETVGEDMELVVRLHVYCRENAMPYRICYVTDAVCWTQVPERLKDLKGQRRRWYVGMLQSMVKHRRIFANPRYGLVGFISWIYFLLYELLSPFIEVFGLIHLIFMYFMSCLNPTFALMYAGIYAGFIGVLSLTAFFARVHTIDLKLTAADVLRAVGICILEVSCLRFILAWARATALFHYQSAKHYWGRIERKQINFK